MDKSEIMEFKRLIGAVKSEPVKSFRDIMQLIGCDSNLIERIIKDIEVKGDLSNELRNFLKDIQGADKIKIKSDNGRITLKFHDKTPDMYYSIESVNGKIRLVRLICGNKVAYNIKEDKLEELEVGISKSGNVKKLNINFSVKNYGRKYVCNESKDFLARISEYNDDGYEINRIDFQNSPSISKTYYGGIGGMADEVHSYHYTGEPSIARASYEDYRKYIKTLRKNGIDEAFDDEFNMEMTQIQSDRSACDLRIAEIMNRIDNGIIKIRKMLEVRMEGYITSYGMKTTPRVVTNQYGIPDTKECDDISYGIPLEGYAISVEDSRFDSIEETTQAQNRTTREKINIENATKNALDGIIHDSESVNIHPTISEKMQNDKAKDKAKDDGNDKVK